MAKSPSAGAPNLRMISAACSFTLPLAPFCSGPPKRCESFFIVRTYSARATTDAAATTGSSSARVRIFSSKFFTAFFASSRWVSGCLENWSSRPHGTHFSLSACSSAVACCHASRRLRLAPGRSISSLYFGMPQEQVFTTAPAVLRIRPSSLRICESASRLLSFTPALSQASMAGLSAMTVAAMTGPKKSPLPLSSSPACGSNRSGCSTSS